MSSIWENSPIRHLTPLLAVIASASPCAWAATPYDGLYRGSSTLAGGASARCEPGRAMTITVRDGAFTWRAGNAEATVTVAADGSFSATSGRRTLSGHITGNQLTGAGSGTNCNYSWALSR